MAFFDNKMLLLSHIRHSFVTSDDTGMCELIMVNEDVEQEIENDNSFQKKSLRMQQRFKQAEKRSQSNLVAASYDIQASPTLSRRPPMKANIDMFQAMEQRKKKTSQVRSIQWQVTPLELVDRSLFTPQPIKPRSPPTPSPLTRLLVEQAKKISNPFFKYSKFNGENHGPNSYKYCIFLSMAKNPLDPVKVSVLNTATVEDLIGVTFWKYYEEKREPLNLKSIQNYSVMIADDDGEIDIDLPELSRDDRISKFGFRYLGIVESAKQTDSTTTEEDVSEKYKIVKVYYENGGFSTIALNDLDVEMSEILARVIRKRRLQIHGYELEKKDSPGEFVNLKSSLSSQGTLDFILVRNTGQLSTLASNDDVDSDDFTTQVTSHQYKSYIVTMLQKMRVNAKVQLGIDSERIEIQPVETQSRGLRSKTIKPMKHDMRDICAIATLEERPNGNMSFRITRMGKEGVKNIDFEAPTVVAKEIVNKVTLILGYTPSTVRFEYEEKKEQKRKGSKMNIKE